MVQQRHLAQSWVCSRCTSSVGSMLANRDTVGSTLPLHLCIVSTFSQPCGLGIPFMCFFHTPQSRFDSFFSVSGPPLATCLASSSHLFSLLSVWPFSRPSFHHLTACAQAGVLSHCIHFGAIRPGHHSAKWDGTPQPRSQVVDGAALFACPPTKRVGVS